MNIYVIVEGEKATKRIYKSWIPLINPLLIGIDDLQELDKNNFFIFMGGGQPEFINNRVPHAIEDVNNLAFDRLVIAVDSEDLPRHEKFMEVRNKVDQIGCKVEVRIIIQHFCLETWLLGNRSNFRRRAADGELISFRSIFDVRQNDPEDLPDNSERFWNRAQFAYHYLRAGLRDVSNGRQTYTKKNPGGISSPGFFSQVRRRHLDDGHINSFADFLSAFS